MRPELKPGCLAMLIRPSQGQLSKRDLEVVHAILGKVVELTSTYVDKWNKTKWLFKEPLVVPLPGKIRRIKSACPQCLLPLNDPDLEISDEQACEDQRPVASV